MKSLKKTILCKAWQMGECSSTPGECRFAHGKQDLSCLHLFKTLMCDDWLADPSSCPRGERCHKAHGDSELRPRVLKCPECSMTVSAKAICPVEDKSEAKISPRDEVVVNNALFTSPPPLPSSSSTNSLYEPPRGSEPSQATKMVSSSLVASSPHQNLCDVVVDGTISMSQAPQESSSHFVSTSVSSSSAQYNPSKDAASHLAPSSVISPSIPEMKNNTQPGMTNILEEIHRLLLSVAPASSFSNNNNDTEKSKIDLNTINGCNTNTDSSTLTCSGSQEKLFASSTEKDVFTALRTLSNATPDANADLATITEVIKLLQQTALTLQSNPTVQHADQKADTSSPDDTRCELPSANSVNSIKSLPNNNHPASKTPLLPNHSSSQTTIHFHGGSHPADSKLSHLPNQSSTATVTSLKGQTQARGRSHNNPSLMHLLNHSQYQQQSSSHNSNNSTLCHNNSHPNNICITTNMNTNNNTSTMTTVSHDDHSSHSLKNNNTASDSQPLSACLPPSEAAVPFIQFSSLDSPLSLPAGHQPTKSVRSLIANNIHHSPDLHHHPLQQRASRNVSVSIALANRALNPPPGFTSLDTPTSNVMSASHSNDGNNHHHTSHVSSSKYRSPSCCVAEILTSHPSPSSWPWDSNNNRNSSSLDQRLSFLQDAQAEKNQWSASSRTKPLPLVPSRHQPPAVSSLLTTQTSSSSLKQAAAPRQQGFQHTQQNQASVKSTGGLTGGLSSSFGRNSPHHPPLLLTSPILYHHSNNNNNNSSNNVNNNNNNPSSSTSTNSNHLQFPVQPPNQNSNPNNTSNITNNNDTTSYTNTSHQQYNNVQQQNRISQYFPCCPNTSSNNNHSLTQQSNQATNQSNTGAPSASAAVMPPPLLMYDLPSPVLVADPNNIITPIHFSTPHHLQRHPPHSKNQVINSQMQSGFVTSSNVLPPLNSSLHTDHHHHHHHTSHHHHTTVNTPAAAVVYPHCSPSSPTHSASSSCAPCCCHNCVSNLHHLSRPPSTPDASVLGHEDYFDFERMHIILKAPFEQPADNRAALQEQKKRNSAGSSLAKGREALDSAEVPQRAAGVSARSLVDRNSQHATDDFERVDDYDGFDAEEIHTATINYDTATTRNSNLRFTNVSSNGIQNAEFQRIQNENRSKPSDSNILANGNVMRSIASLVPSDVKSANNKLIAPVEEKRALSSSINNNQQQHVNPVSLFDPLPPPRTKSVERLRNSSASSEQVANKKISVDKQVIADNLDSNLLDRTTTTTTSNVNEKTNRNNFINNVILNPPLLTAPLLSSFLSSPIIPLPLPSFNHPDVSPPPASVSSSSLAALSRVVAAQRCWTNYIAAVHNHQMNSNAFKNQGIIPVETVPVVDYSNSSTTYPSNYVMHPPPYPSASSSASQIHPQHHPHTSVYLPPFSSVYQPSQANLVYQAPCSQYNLYNQQCVTSSFAPVNAPIENVTSSLQTGDVSTSTINKTNNMSLPKVEESNASAQNNKTSSLQTFHNHASLHHSYVQSMPSHIPPTTTIVIPPQHSPSTSITSLLPSAPLIIFPTQTSHSQNIHPYQLHPHHFPAAHSSNVPHSVLFAPHNQITVDSLPQPTLSIMQTTPSLIQGTTPSGNLVHQMTSNPYHLHFMPPTAFLTNNPVESCHSVMPIPPQTQHVAQWQ
eukprot:GDKJ01016260.1.p1 GENE.GDKJ01016260.1~~GDKJ01016260.1.p1  ORF type:complete len:1711 (+),score=452.84 GDKJ01016260.1:185-5134(+)